MKKSKFKKEIFLSFLNFDFLLLNFKFIIPDSF